MTAEPPRLGVLLAPSELGETKVRDAAVLVVDVLRATTTIPRALDAGASRVIPADSVEQAKQLKERLGDHALLCGEREGKKIPGFDLGNSPLEYVPEAVAERVLIFSSTNGTRVMVKSLEARRVALASFVNLERAAAWAAAQEGTLLIVCSGKLGRASLEDVACAGSLVERLRERRPDLEPDDGALLASLAWTRWATDVPGLLRASAHGRYLESIGFADDLDFAAAVDTVDRLPVLRDGQFEASSDAAESQAAR